MVLFDKLKTTFLAKKDLFTIICFTEFYNLKRITLFALFLGMGKRIVYSTRNCNVKIAVFTLIFLPLNPEVEYYEYKRPFEEPGE